MPKYLVQGSYTAEGARGLVQEGGRKRLNAVKKVMKDLGGKVDALYWALGEDDLCAIVDAPDNISVAALSLAVSAGGAASVRTTVLLTPTDVDEAAKKTVTYRPPGQ